MKKNVRYSVLIQKKKKENILLSLAESFICGYFVMIAWVKIVSQIAHCEMSAIVYFILQCG